MAGSRFWVEIVCVDCAKSHCGSGRFVHGRQIPVTDMNAMARKDGWLLMRNGQHRCDKCTKDLIRRIDAGEVIVE